MSTIERSKKRIGKVVLGLSFYALLTVPCASQTSDNLSVPRASLEKLESAIESVADAMRAITSTQKPTSQAPLAALRDPNLPTTLSEGCIKRDQDHSERPQDRGCCEQPRDRDCYEHHACYEHHDCYEHRECCEPHRDRDCCEPHRDCCEPRRDCCEPHRYREPRHSCCEHRYREPHHYRGCCEQHRYHEPHHYRWRAPPCDYCGRWGLYDEY